MAFGSVGARFRNIAGPWAGYGTHARASYTTALAGTNNDLDFTARTPGPDGNGITVTYVVAGASTPLTVSRSGKNLTVNVATNGSSAATSTAAQVAAAVNASDEARHLVNASNATGNDGTGVVTAMAQQTLAGGAAREYGTGAGGFSRVPFLRGRRP